MRRNFWAGLIVLLGGLQGWALAAGGMPWYTWQYWAVTGCTYAILVSVACLAIEIHNESHKHDQGL